MRLPGHMVNVFFNFVRNDQSVFLSISIILYSPQQCVRVPWLHILTSFSYVFRHSTRCEVACCGLNVRIPKGLVMLDIFSCAYLPALFLPSLLASFPAEWTKPLEVLSHVPCSPSFIPVHVLCPVSMVPNALSLYMSG